MKLEHFLAQHLYNSKSLTLQGIGSFTLLQDFVAPAEGDKDFVMPENAISFAYNGRATEDDALVTYLAQQTKKIRPLASADLDSYLTLGKEFLNIGKPFNIDGIGSLEKNQTGEYFFTQGHYINQKVESSLNTQASKENVGKEISFSSLPKESKLPKKVLTITGLVLLLGVLGAGTWYFASKQNSSNSTKLPNQAETKTIENTLNTNTVAKNDIVNTNPNAVIAKDSFTYKIVIKNYRSIAAASKSYNKLTSYGHKLLLYTKDSIIYKVAMPFTRPLSDTAYARDSVKKKLFGGNPYIEIN